MHHFGTFDYNFAKKAVQAWLTIHGDAVSVYNEEQFVTYIRRNIHNRSFIWMLISLGKVECESILWEEPWL